MSKEKAIILGILGAILLLVVLPLVLFTLKLVFKLVLVASFIALVVYAVSFLKKKATS